VLINGCPKVDEEIPPKTIPLRLSRELEMNIGREEKLNNTIIFRFSRAGLVF